MKKRNTAAKKDGDRFYRVMYRLVATPIRFLFRLKTVGQENEPEAGPYLVCANHQSATDPVLICAAFRKNPVGFMAKAELFFWPLGPLIRALGAYPVKRQSGDVGAIRTSIQLLQSGKLVGMFPQGHRYPGVDPKTTEPKSGAGMICIKAGVPVIPVYIRRKKYRPAFLRRTEIILGKPITQEELAVNPDAPGEYARVSRLIFERICALENEHD
jgi:1-acyl-sn-glycerol-3-phosphate acyltransferase